MVGPDYKPPTAKIATQWLEFEDPRLKTTSPVEPLWWKLAFHDPVLNALINEALAENLTLRSAGLRVVQAHQQLLITKGTLFPQEQYLGATAAGVDDPVAGIVGVTGFYSLGFNLSWEIDVWGRIRRQIESASVGGHRCRPVELRRSHGIAHRRGGADLLADSDHRTTAHGCQNERHLPGGKRAYQSGEGRCR